MKQFISRLLRFAVVFSAATLLFLVAFIGFLKLELVGRSFATGKSVLLIGNSLPQTAIDDELCADVFNAAQSGEQAFQSYVKLRSFLRENKQTRLVLYGVGYGHMNRSKLYKLDNIGYFDDTLPLLEAQDLVTLLRLRPKVLKNAIRKSAADFSGNMRISRKNPNEFLRRWGGGRRMEPVPHKDIYFAYQGHPLTDEPPCEFVYKIKELCDKNGVVFAFFHTPIYTREDPEGAKRFEAQRAQYRPYFPDVPLFDISDCDFPKDFYNDYRHLNKNGQKAATKIFNGRLPEFMRTCGIETPRP